MGIKVKDVTLFNLDHPGQSKVITGILMLRTMDGADNDKHFSLKTTEMHPSFAVGKRLESTESRQDNMGFSSYC